MEHLKIKFSHFSLHAISAALARPDLIWRGIIIGISAISLVLGVLGFLAHAWATHTAPVTLPPGVNRADVTAEDIRRVLDVYSAKQVRFNDLHRRAPVAPNLGTGMTTLSTTELEGSTTSSQENIQP